MSLKTAIKVVLVLIGISFLLNLCFDFPLNDVKSILKGLLFLPICFVLLVYIPSLFVVVMVKLFPKHGNLRYLPTVLAVDGLLFFIHRLFFSNNVNKGLGEIVVFMSMVCVIAVVSSFIASKINSPYENN